MVTDFWNERYKKEEYVYGIAPNQFFKSELLKLNPGKILLPADGEGRNAVFAAKSGWEAIAFDTSTEGKRKATELAEIFDTSIEYHISSYADFEYQENTFDAIAIVYAHMPSSDRTSFYKKCYSMLKSGGKIIVEVFSTDQLGKLSGGPKDIDLLYTRESLLRDFSDLVDIQISEHKIDLDEGAFHVGGASVIRMVGIK